MNRTGIAKRVLALARRIAPPSRETWVRAMENEASAAAADGAALRFALGCLLASARMALGTRRGLAVAGRLSLAVGLIGSGVAGMVWAVMMLKVPLAAVSVGLACLFYVTGGAFAWRSVRALRTYAVIGLTVAIAGWLGAVLAGHWSVFGSAYLAALSLEFGLVMAVLFAGTLGLQRLHPGPADA